MSKTTKVTLEVRDHILLIGLNRPEKLNAADEEMLHGLSLAYGQLDADPNLRVGLVFGHGDHFTAGLDLMDVGPKLAAGKLSLVPEGGLDPWGMSTRQVRKPVVMATRGTCFTLGVELALASEVVIAASDSKFAQLEVARAILPLRMNLVTEVVEPGQEFERALELAGRIAAQAPLAVQATLASGRNADTEAERQKVFERLASLMQTNDVQRGLQAFMTKQPAKFEGN